MKKKQAFVIICEFSNYLNEKEKFWKDHPTAIVTEEIKNLFMQVVDIPRVPGLALPKGQTNLLMISCGIIFEEEVAANANGESKLILKPN